MSIFATNLLAEKTDIIKGPLQTVRAKLLN